MCDVSTQFPEITDIELLELPIDYWREMRYEHRYTLDVLYKDVIDSALPDEITSDKCLSDYMVDFYKESNFSEEWLNTSNHMKRFMLDVELDEYMNSVTVIW